MQNLTGGRFLTFNSIVRVNQIEATRDLNLGEDEGALHTPQKVESLRSAVEAGWPGARMTWGVSWHALIDQRPQYRQIRQLLRNYHQRHGDQVTCVIGGFCPNGYGTRQQINQDHHDALALVSEMMGNAYRPDSVICGFLAAENQRFLAEQENIHVCQGNIWSQFGIDLQDGDGSICYPYYPSREHFCKPAQSGRGESAGDFIDSVCLDGWTCDFLAARREGFSEGFNSRLGVGPIETLGKYGAEIGLKQMQETTAVHFDTGFNLNGFAWVANCWETVLVTQIGLLQCLTDWLKEIRRRWPDAQCPTQGEFGLLWRNHYQNNQSIDYRFAQRGTSIGGSDADKSIRWFMNREFRLALLRDELTGDENLIDFTRYDRPATEPKDKTRRWSLFGQINQKQTRPQDHPRPLRSLSPQDQDYILTRYPRDGWAFERFA